MRDGFAIAIMAAGKGTRLKSRRPKVLHEIGGQALLLHVIAAAQRRWCRRTEIYCIVGHEAERVRAAVASRRACGLCCRRSSVGRVTRCRW